jgi:hypothetical protein
MMGVIGPCTAGIDQLRLPPGPANPADRSGAKALNISRM